MVIKGDIATKSPNDKKIIIVKIGHQIIITIILNNV